MRPLNFYAKYFRFTEAMTPEKKALYHQASAAAKVKISGQLDAPFQPLSFTDPVEDISSAHPERIHSAFLTEFHPKHGAHTQVTREARMAAASSLLAHFPHKFVMSQWPEIMNGIDIKEVPQFKGKPFVVDTNSFKRPTDWK